MEDILLQLGSHLSAALFASVNVNEFLLASVFTFSAKQPQMRSNLVS